MAPASSQNSPQQAGWCRTLPATTHLDRGPSPGPVQVLEPEAAEVSAAALASVRILPVRPFRQRGLHLGGRQRHASCLGGLQRREGASGRPFPEPPRARRTEPAPRCRPPSSAMGGAGSSVRNCSLTGLPGRISARSPSSTPPVPTWHPPAGSFSFDRTRARLPPLASRPATGSDGSLGCDQDARHCRPARPPPCSRRAPPRRPCRPPATAPARTGCDSSGTSIHSTGAAQPVGSTATSRPSPEVAACRTPVRPWHRVVAEGQALGIGDQGQLAGQQHPGAIGLVEEERHQATAPALHRTPVPHQPGRVLRRRRYHHPTVRGHEDGRRRPRQWHGARCARDGVDERTGPRDRESPRAPPAASSPSWRQSTPSHPPRLLKAQGSRLRPAQGSGSRLKAQGSGSQTSLPEVPALSGLQCLSLESEALSLALSPVWRSVRSLHSRTMAP